MRRWRKVRDLLESDGRSSEDHREARILYEGNLTFIFADRSLCRAISIIPATIFRHMLHVLWLCHQACRYYQPPHSAPDGKPAYRCAVRNLLTAALFHDFDHPEHRHPAENDPERPGIVSCRPFVLHVLGAAAVSQELIQAKIEEIEQLLRLLETAPASAAGD
jgi:hypothetical protein